MIFALQCLAIYALVCMVHTAIVMFQNFNEVKAKIPPETRYGVFIPGVIFVILTSPFWIPSVVMSSTRRICKEIINRCRSLDEDLP